MAGNGKPFSAIFPCAAGRGVIEWGQESGRPAQAGQPWKGGKTMAKRVFLIVLDSVGIGEEPDAAAYGDEGSHTLRACWQS